MQPHRSRYWLNADHEDPDVFRQQVGAICDLYEQAGRLAEQGIHLVSTDEKTGIQALERLYPDIPPGPGRVQLREYEYIRHGTLCLTANYSGPRKLDHRLSYSGGSAKGGAMAGRRKVHTAAFKAQVALAALKGDRTVNELAGYYCLRSQNLQRIPNYPEQAIEPREPLPVYGQLGFFALNE